MQVICVGQSADDYTNMTVWKTYTTYDKSVTGTVTQVTTY